MKLGELCRSFSFRFHLSQSAVLLHLDFTLQKKPFSYFLTFMEPVLMFVLMLILPPLLGGQQMIWWSTTAARILSALAALIMKREIEKENLKINKAEIRCNIELDHL